MLQKVGPDWAAKLRFQEWPELLPGLPCDWVERLRQVQGLPSDWEERLRQLQGLPCDWEERLTQPQGMPQDSAELLKSLPDGWRVMMAQVQGRGKTCA